MFSTVSVIVPTYNRPDALRLSLQSLALQSRLPDQVLVADDGSGDETRLAIDEFRNSAACRFELLHIWHEDDGFRKPKILNETVRHATGDYLLFLDGDCMAHRHFVRRHLALAEERAMVGGKRVEIGRELTERLLAGKSIVNRLTLPLLVDSIIGASRKVEESISIPFGVIRRFMGWDRINDDGIWGCNFGVSRELFYAINGCDEDFLDGSVEDNDLGIRVINAGGRLKSARGAANVFHLWHRASWGVGNDKHSHNLEILTRRIAQRESRCMNGIVKLTAKEGEQKG